MNYTIIENNISKIVTGVMYYYKNGKPGKRIKSAGKNYPLEVTHWSDKNNVWIKTYGLDALKIEVKS